MAEADLKCHPHPDKLLEFAEKMAKQIGPHYIARTAEMVKRDFPGSADYLLPRLHDIYTKAKRK